MTCDQRGGSVPIMQITDQIGRPLRRTTVGVSIAAALLSASAVSAMEPDDRGARLVASMTIEVFLDRLMIAESGGRDAAKNPLSTALGPFQFINATFLDLVRRYFGEETAGLSVPQVLALRTDRAFSRRVAQIYTAENARHLAAGDAVVTYPSLRLAFLLGPSGALRVLQAPPETRIAQLVGPGVMKANPFLHGLTASGLIARAARDLKLPSSDVAAVSSDGATSPPKPKLATVLVPALSAVPTTGPAAAPVAMARATKKALAPKLDIRCNQALASCRKWVAMQSKALVQKQPAPKRTKAAALR